jgi:ATP/maltotriose-dependent transcriptional regulator MalT/DNA-binding SARP family transcriptional activator
MSQATPELAKLSRPRLYRAAPRERLFRRLDELRERPVVWITGAGGSGKTTLAASYLEARRVPTLWYQQDAGDADPASFFYYLGLAAQSLRRKLPPLPLLTEEYRRDLPGFVRRFARELFARLPAGGVLVLDGFRPAEQGTPMYGVAAAAFEEVPAGINLLVLSRDEPPLELARLIATQRLARLDEAELRFTREEAAQLLAAGNGLPADAVAAIHERVQGWAAGLILMREHAAREPEALARAQRATPDAVFDYFAGEIFSRLKPARQRFFMLTALMPRLTAAAASALTGEADAERLLDNAYRRHLFVTRRQGVPPVYDYHALFREFLLARARALLPASELRAATLRAAELVEAAGTPGDAFPLYVEAEDWTRAASIVRERAPTLLAQGRFQSLLERIAALPEAVRHADPWLAYWEGAAGVNVDPTLARRRLEEAYQGFESHRDLAGCIQAAEAVIVSHYLAWDDWRPLDRWIAVVQRLIEASDRFPSEETEARALSSLAIALVYRQPANPALRPALARLQALVARQADGNARVAMATRLLDALNKAGDYRESLQIAMQTRGIADGPEVRPLSSAWFRVWLANTFYFCAHFAEFDTALVEARTIADSHALGFIVPVITLFRGYGRLAAGDLAGAQPLLDDLQAKLDPSRRLDLALLQFLKAYAAMSRGDFAAGEREARIAAQLSLETGSAGSILICHTALLLALLESRQDAAAAIVLDRMRALVDGLTVGILPYHVALWEAYAALVRGSDGWRAPLARALALGREQGYLNNYLWWPPMMSRLAALAMQEGLERDHVRELVVARGIAPPPNAPDDWPWRVRIRALGGFTVERDGEALRASGKAQKKPLELLKVLIALGGRGVDASRLAAVLWPDAHGDAAKLSFDTTLYRLRKLLGHDTALLLSEGKLTLDEAYVWLDVRAFEAAVARVDALLAIPEAEAGALSAAAAALVGAYPGPFLAGEDDQPWLISLRDRLRAKLIRGVLDLGRRLQSQRQWREAAALFAHGLEADNLAEPLYRELMVCHRELGETAEALRAFRRCRDLLSMVLGLAPSAETEAVRRTLSA